MTRISFLVPTFNRSAYLPEALAAILGQIGDEDELVVIDDGSTDATPAIVASHPRVRYIRQDNAGKSVALNRGLAESAGDYVWVCDDDDILRPDMVDRLAALMGQTSSALVFGKYTRVARNSNQYNIDLGIGYWPDLSKGSIVRHVFEDHFIMQNSSLLRRGYLENIGGFNENLPRSLDYEFSLRIVASFPVTYVDEIVYSQRQHSGVRGPAKMAFPASASVDNWRRFDRLIFENVYQHVPLALFEAMFDCPDANRLRRAALLQRATVMARHDCPDLALADWRTAAAVSSKPLDHEERRICARALSGKHGFQCFTGEDVVVQFRVFRRSSRAGGAIARAVLNGLLWQIRGRGSDTSARATSLLFQAGGINTAARIAAERLLPASSFLTERKELPMDAYLAPGVLPLVAG